MALSKARAQVVTTYLEQNFGIPPVRLVPVGYGKEHLLEDRLPNQTPDPRNRRVQVVNIGA